MMRYLLTISAFLLAFEGIAQDRGGSTDTTTRRSVTRTPYLVIPTVNPLEVEEEFKKIYLDYCKRRHYPARYGDFLDTVVMIQLNYLCSLERNMITHDQFDVPKYRSVGHRLFSVYPVHRGDYAEVAIYGNITDEYTPKEEAQRFFDSFMRSPGHRKVMTKRTFRYYGFKFKYNIHGWLVGVGVFSEMWGNE